MHELSIISEVVEQAIEHATAGGAARVRMVTLRIGPLAGVEPEALRFAYELATAGTILAGSQLEVVPTALTAYCPVCRVEKQIELPQRLRCPDCGSGTPNITGGRELELASLEVE